jgi:translocation and assembly module TamA
VAERARPMPHADPDNAGSLVAENVAMPSPRTCALLCLCCVWTLLDAACASIPKGQYGVKNIEWVGVKAMNSEALESCLVTKKREAWNIRLGISSPSCGKPPFDWSAPDIKLVTMPWTEWPIYDPAIFEVERQRIERWYQARGYYDAHVLSVKAFMDGHEVQPDECRPDESCKLKIVVTLSEGQPTHVDSVRILSTTPLPAAVLERLREDISLKRGRRFDESNYNDDKTKIEQRMIAGAYARAKVWGKVSVNRSARTADVEYHIDPGPECVFGKVTVEGAADVPVDLVIQTAHLPVGDKYDQELVDDAERSIFALRVFSAVRAERRGDGRVVDIALVLQRGRITGWSAGIGVMSGTLRLATSTSDTQSIPQWDIHLSGMYENRNLFGGLRYFNAEERPRLIFQSTFPGFDQPRIGNILSLKFEQPATFEARTTLFSSADWDVGPDPYEGYFRHDIRAKIGLRRSFWRRRITLSLAVEQDFYHAFLDNKPNDVSNYILPFLEQSLEFDLRGDARRPRLGAYAALILQEASRLWGFGTFSYIRVLPDIRVYVPVFLDIVIAARFALGALFMNSTAGGLDPQTELLGPAAYRLRGGGANSNRGFFPGRLGDSEVVDGVTKYYGGTRRYEGSLEARIPLGGDFGVVVFGDIGDVSTSFRFNHLNTSLGFGFRYHSVLGALRLDAAWRIPGAQVINGPEPELTVNGWPSAVALTIGEAF